MSLRIKNMCEEFTKTHVEGSLDRCFFLERRNNRRPVDVHQVIFASLYLFISF